MSPFLPFEIDTAPGSQSLTLSPPFGAILVLARHFRICRSLLPPLTSSGVGAGGRGRGPKTFILSSVTLDETQFGLSSHCFPRQSEGNLLRVEVQSLEITEKSGHGTRMLLLRPMDKCSSADVNKELHDLCVFSSGRRAQIGTLDSN